VAVDWRHFNLSTENIRDDLIMTVQDSQLSLVLVVVVACFVMQLHNK